MRGNVDPSNVLEEPAFVHERDESEFEVAVALFIAAFLSSSDSYRGKNATGVGVRLFYDFIKNIAKGN